MVTIENVVAGLNKFNLTLKKGGMLKDDDTCCCALAADILADYDEMLDENAIWEKCKRKHGLAFTTGFWLAFDGGPCYEKCHQEGYENGKAIRQQCIDMNLL